MLAYELIESTSSTLDEIASKTAHKDIQGDYWEKRSKAMNEGKAVQNKNKRPKKFLKIIPVQKEVPLSYKLQDLAFE